MLLTIDIGNTHQHWGWFEQGNLVEVAHYTHDFWDTDAINRADKILVCSVVPALLASWQTYDHVQILTLKDLALSGSYQTLGIDRALNIVGAGYRYGFPVLVIDFGTAITLTAANQAGTLLGGQILPGFTMQFRALHDYTAMLPLVDLPDHWPEDLAGTTEQALQSGVFQTTLAGLEQQVLKYRQRGTKVIITGGDSVRVASWSADWFDHQDAHLNLWGMYATARRDWDDVVDAHDSSSCL